MGIQINRDGLKFSEKGSKRVSARKRYKIEKKVREHNRKVRRDAKKNPKSKSEYFIELRVLKASAKLSRNCITVLSLLYFIFFIIMLLLIFISSCTKLYYNSFFMSLHRKGKHDTSA